VSRARPYRAHKSKQKRAGETQYKRSLIVIVTVILASGLSSITFRVHKWESHKLPPLRIYSMTARIFCEALTHPILFSRWKGFKTPIKRRRFGSHEKLTSNWTWDRSSGGLVSAGVGGVPNNPPNPPPLPGLSRGKSCCVIAGSRNGFGGGEPRVVLGGLGAPVRTGFWLVVFVFAVLFGAVVGFAAVPLRPLRPLLIPGKPPKVGRVPIYHIRLAI